MKKVKTGKLTNSLILNQVEFNVTYDIIQEIALSRFVWDVPDTVNKTFLEKSIQRNGKAVVFEDEVMGVVGLQCTYNSDFDIYNEPRSVRAYAVNGYQKVVTNNVDGVVVFNNFLRQSTTPLIEYYAQKLSLINSILNLNVNVQKTPFLIRTSNEQRLTMQNLLLKLEEFAPFIKMSSKWDIESLSVMNLNAPYLADRLYELRESVWNEMLTMLGIPSLREQKKERLIVDEVNRSMGGTLARRQSYLLERVRACEKMKKMFNKNFSCEFNDNIESYASQKESEVLSGGTLYDDNKRSDGVLNE